MLIETQAVEPFFKNGFVVSCEETREAVLIDPGAEVEALLAFAGREKLDVRYILLTHAHVDHVTGVAAAKRALGVPICLHKDDLFLYERVEAQGLMFGIRVQPLPPVDHFYMAGEAIGFGRYAARPHHTPGHCPGGVCLEVATTDAPGRHLFVGDTLFAGSVGRTDFPGGDYDQLLASVSRLVDSYPLSTRVYPGHMEATTLAAELAQNPFLTGLLRHG